mmetsp:Transcript_16974/g.34946  ORF Transcript_16974/g.34946 Transcript_16974/m.34946 type:complete len:220 (-) Transcript_16974:462-1121(-)
MWLILSALPDFSTAATESPPPIIVQAPLAVISSRTSTIAKVPLAKASNSKTPMGPFQMTVLQSARAAEISFVASGPLSSPIQPSGMAVAGTTCVFASAEKASATTMSEGRMSCFPLASALAMTALAVSTKSSSAMEDPTERPLALRKVKTMPPPMTTLSHLSRRASSTVILEDTLDPPTIAAIGLSPLFTAPSRYSSSLARRKPETEGEMNLVTPSVEA